MQAIKAFFDGSNFRPSQPVPVHGQYEVVITFVEPIKPVYVSGATNHDELSKRREMLKSLKGCMKGVEVDLSKTST